MKGWVRIVVDQRAVCVCVSVLVCVCVCVCVCVVLTGVTDGFVCSNSIVVFKAKEQQHISNILPRN